MDFIVGNLSDWKISDNKDGTKCLTKENKYGAKVIIHRALIHEDIQMIEPLAEFDITKMKPYS